MHWRNWPYWLKGIVIGAIIGALIAVIFFISIYACAWITRDPNDSESGLGCIFFALPFEPLWSANLSSAIYLLAAIAMYAFPSAVIGALIAVLARRIKFFRKNETS